MVKKSYIPDRGDIIWLEFEPTRGHQQKGLRPAFVVSPKAYNAKVGLLLACPVTSQRKGYPFEVRFRIAKAAQNDSVILADHIRSLDWKARRARYIGTVPASIVSEVGHRLLTLVQ